MLSIDLAEIGFPNIIAFEDDIFYNTTTNKFLGYQGDRRLYCENEDKSLQQILTRCKVLRWCFKAPWRTGKTYKSLKCVDCSRYYATADGGIFGVRNMDYLTPKYTKDGYRTIHLYTDSGDYMPWRVDRLIASAFLPNPENKDTVDHKNNLRDDDRLENLRWM